MITVSLNKQQHSINDQTSLEVFLKSLEIEFRGIAVAINQNIITKSMWDTTVLQNGDAILIIKATQGG